MRVPAFYASSKIERSWFADNYDYNAALYFLNQVHWRKISWRSNSQRYSQLKFDYLRNVITRRGTVKTVIQTLTEHGVIECDHSWLAGVKCQGFRTLEPYVITRRHVCDDPSLTRRIVMLSQQRRRDRLPVHHWLESKLDTLHVHWATAYPILSRLKPRRRGTVPVKEHRRNRQDILAMLANHDSYFEICPYHRVHTLVTVVENVLLPALRVDTPQGLQPLVSIDLANSQPLLLCLALLSHSGSAPSNGHPEGDQEGHQGGQRDGNTTTIKHTTTQHPYYDGEVCYRSSTIYPPAKNYDGDNPSKGLSLRQSLSLCEQGEFYESLMHPGDDRKRIKTRTYRIMFGRNVPRRFASAMRQRLANVHPDMYEGLCALKESDYHHSSYLLQEFEAKIFIETICVRIMRERPHIPVFTKHDSILTTPPHVDYVKKVILDEFHKLGVNPTLKIK